MHEEKGAFRFLEGYVDMLVMLLFFFLQFCLHIFCLFLGLAIKKNKKQIISIHYYLCDSSAWNFWEYVCIESSVCLASFWNTGRLHFVFFLLILFIHSPERADMTILWYTVLHSFTPSILLTAWGSFLFVSAVAAGSLVVLESNIDGNKLFLQ